MGPNNNSDQVVASNVPTQDDYTIMMVHELRTPLTTIVYSTNMLLSDFERINPVDIKSQLQVIHSTTEHLLSLVNDLLDVAKIEAGKIQIAKSLGDLKVVVNEKLAMFTPLASQKHLTLQANVDPTLPNFNFDHLRISQVLDNLLSNAIKYTKTGGISIKVSLSNQLVTVEVKDTGEGISQEDLNKLFNKFERVGAAKTDGSVGTGLGLVIVKGIVEAHGGKIWATSDGLDKGSTFTFTLPLG